MAVDADEASSALIAQLLAQDNYEANVVNPSGKRRMCMLFQYLIDFLLNMCRVL